MTLEAFAATPNFRRFAMPLMLLVAMSLVGAVVYWPDGERELSDEELVAQALEANDVDVKNQAAAKLIARHRDSMGQIRRLYEQTDDQVVRATCIQGMGRLYDYQSMDELLSAMEDPSPLIRARANQAVVRMIGLDGHFDANGPIGDRQRIIGFYRMQWEKMRGSAMVDEFEQIVDERYGAKSK